MVEIVPLDGAVPSAAGQAGELGEIVVTDLNSAAFPFIRYRTGDVGSWAEGRARAEGRFRRSRRSRGEPPTSSLPGTGGGFTPCPSSTFSGRWSRSGSSA